MSQIVKLPKPRQPKPESKAETIIGSGVPPKDGPWSVTDLYLRSAKNRRVMFLELIVWAIHQAESCSTRAEFAAFEQELREIREQLYCSRPWNGATEPEPFLRHVVGMAEAFTADWPEFPARRRQPMEQG